MAKSFWLMFFYYFSLGCTVHLIIRESQQSLVCIQVRQNIQIQSSYLRSKYITCGLVRFNVAHFQPQTIKRTSFFFLFLYNWTQATTLKWLISIDFFKWIYFPPLNKICFFLHLFEWKKFSLAILFLKN